MSFLKTMELPSYQVESSRHSHDYAQLILPKATLMVLYLLALMLVWEHYSAQPSVKRFFAAILKVRQTSS